MEEEKEKDLIRLNHMRTESLRVELLTHEISKYENLLKDWKKQHIIARCLEIIGEASHHVSDNTKKKYKKVDWRRINDLRNIIVHEYSGLDFKKIWKIATEDIPVLISQVDMMIKDLKRDKNQT